MPFLRAVMEVAGVHAVAAAALREVADGDLFRMSERDNFAVLSSTVNTASMTFTFRLCVAGIVTSRLQPAEGGETRWKTLSMDMVSKAVVYASDFASGRLTTVLFLVQTC